LWESAGVRPARSRRWNAIVRPLQCVSPGGASRRVNRTISSTISATMEGLRHRPGRTAEKSFRPSSENRSRHALHHLQDTTSVSRLKFVDGLRGGGCLGGLGPHERLAPFVVSVDERADRRDEIFDAVKRSVADRLTGDDREEQLYEVQLRP
jgi:hypothetical protein